MEGARSYGTPSNHSSNLIGFSVTLLPVVCLTVVDFPKPSGKPSQSRRLAEEGLKDDQIHTKHIHLPGGPQNAQHQAKRTILGSSWLFWNRWPPSIRSLLQEGLDARPMWIEKLKAGLGLRGLLRPSSLRLHSFPALLSPWASRASP